MNKLFWVIIGVVIALFIGTAWVNSTGGSDSVTTNNGIRSTHIKGKQDAKVTLVEYSDFQCPACKAYYPMVEQTIEKYKDQISFEYRHYPLATIHRNAFAAARASEAASNQGKFWEMYHLLFNNQSAWESSSNPQPLFVSYAKQLGIDGDQFAADFANSRTNDTINASIAEFNERGLPQSTPTFLLNNKKIEPHTLEDFSKLIDKQLQLANTQ